MDTERDQRRTRRGTDPLALALFGLLRDLGEEDLRLVLGALDGARSRVRGERVALVASAIGWYRSESRAPLSKRRFTAWRREHPDRASIPSATFVENTFGGWAKAMDALGVRPAADHRARRLRSLGTRPSNDQVLADLGRCGAELGLRRLRFSDYRRWALDQERAGRGPEALLVSPNTFSSRFGSFPRALLAAGLEPAGRGPSGRTSDHTRERLIACLREAAGARRGSGALTIADYERWRAERIEHARGAGEWLAVPGTHAIRRRFGSWPGALAAAGLVSARRAAHNARGRGRQMSSEQIAAGLIDAARELGDRLSFAGYEHWRTARVRDLSRPRPPSRSLIHRKVGSWSRARGLALAAVKRPDPLSWLTDRIRRLGR